MKLNEKKKDSLFKILICGEIQFLIYIIRFLISAKVGIFVWTIERLTSHFAGIFIQILDLVLFVNGVIIAIYIVIFLILLLKS